MFSVIPVGVRSTCVCMKFVSVYRRYLSIFVHRFLHLQFDKSYIGDFSFADIIHLQGSYIVLAVSYLQSAIKSVIHEVGNNKSRRVFFDGVGEILQCTPISVCRLDGSNTSNSRIMCSTCFFPFLGGINFSILSEKNITPTLSLFWIVENASVAATSGDNILFQHKSGTKIATTRHIHQQHYRQFTFFFKYLDEWVTKTGSNVPVDGTHIVIYWYSRTSAKVIPHCPEPVWYDIKYFARVRAFLSLFSNFF